MGFHNSQKWTMYHKHTAFPNQEASWGRWAVPGCPRRDGFSQVGCRGLIDARLGLSKVGWRRGIFTALLDSHGSSHTDPAISPSPFPQSTLTCAILKRVVLPDAHGSQSSNSSMTTRELQEYWRTQKRCWKHVKLLFEIASARIEEGRVSKFVVSRDQKVMACLHGLLPGPGQGWWHLSLLDQEMD